MAYLEIKNLQFTYPLSEAPAVKDVSFSVKQGELILLCGPSGSGKTTLLQHLKPAITPAGRSRGAVELESVPLTKLSLREQTARVGYVMQSPDAQLVTDRVWHELAFGLENLGLSTDAIRLRVAEMVNYFGLQSIFHREVNSLSGGQKQLVNLAAVMAMEPEILVLDEPTSQLDPIAAAGFLELICRINRELGVTVLLSEHRVEEIFGLADQVAVMEDGKLISFTTPQETGRALKAHPQLLPLLPAPVQIACALAPEERPPLTVGQGRKWLREYAAAHAVTGGAIPRTDQKEEEAAAQLHRLWFRYEKDGGDVLRDCSLTIPKGKITCVLGANGSGKTTLLKTLCGLCVPYQGWVKLDGKKQKPRKGKGFTDVALLPQEPRHLFLCKTVEEDLRAMPAEEKAVAAMAESLGISHLLPRHPYDLSGGELQKAALAKVLLAKPKLLLLDEPTKGLDATYKPTFAAILQGLIHRGITVVLVSHDVEFCARYSHYAALFFDGGLAAAAATPEFFRQNRYYTTAARRISRGLFENAVTNEEVVALCKGEG